jgi:nucleoid DNA-binding protein
MNKSELINEISKVVGTKKEADKVLECVLTAITGALKKKESVSIIGFGAFKVTTRQARTGRNPKTGEEIKIKAKNSPKFIPGKALKDTVNQ